MKPGGRVAAGVGLGYLLGRTRKMRLALMIAAAGATGTVRSPRALVQQGLKQLGSSPELGKITEMARGELLNAAKSAAVSVASHRIDSLNERLQERAGVPGGATPGAEQQEPEPAAPESTPDEETVAEETGAAEGQARGPDGAGGTSSRTAPRPRSAEESAVDESPRARTRARTETGRSPVRRTRSTRR
ncbi:MAG TPA: hypothetical protein VFG87_08565 [Amycolatopsis sp.]|jgi:hypothetical protein|nr:hypothetical protein [Amycolatopsis sp.]